MSQQSSSFSSSRCASRFGQCPLCEGFLPWYKLEMHAATCMGVVASTRESERTMNSSKDCTAEANGTRSSKRPGCELLIGSSNPTMKKKARDNSVLVEATDLVPIPKDGPSKENLDMAPNRTLSRLLTNFPATTTPAPIFNPIKSIPNSTLHHSQEQLPPGLFFYPDFITVQEEEQLLQLLDDPKELPGWKMGRFNGQHAGKRWGVHCNLRDRRVEAPEHPLPTVLQQLVLDKLSHLPCWHVLATKRGPKFKAFCPNEANAIDYRRQRGDWLQAHVDDRKLSTEPIANLSLAGDCIMTFAAVDGHCSFRVTLPRRGLQILTGLARYNHTHAIANRDLLSDRRVSITMRESPPTMVKTNTHTQSRSPK